MSSSFLQKIEPFLLSDDLIIQEFIWDALQEYPNVPPEWTNRLLKEAIRSEDKKMEILLGAHDFPLNEDSVPLLLQLWNITDIQKYPPLIHYFTNLNPEWTVKYEQDMPSIFTKDYLAVCHFLVESSQDELQKEYDEILAALEEKQFVDSNLFSIAKQIQDRLLMGGVYNKDTIHSIMSKNLDEPFFSYAGILAVRAIGKLKMEEFIPDLAGFLVRDEDLLNEEASKALSKFQSDKAAEAVASYARGTDYFFAMDVLKNTKTPFADEVLVDAYNEQDMAGKALIIRGLAYHLSEKAFPLMQDYLDNGFRTGIYDIETVFYGLHAVLGKHHPDMEKWKAEYERREKAAEERRKETELLFQRPAAPMVKEEKVGRNEKCPCGSGKKYKKCCGA